MAIALSREMETVTPTAQVDLIEKDYKASYATGVCLALLNLYGEDDFRRWFPGGLDECIRKAEQFADLNFDKWKVKWGPKLAYSIKAIGG